MLSRTLLAMIIATGCWAQTSRTFERVLLIEEKGETSAGVSIGDLDRDGDPDVLLAKGRHWPLHNQILLNDGKGRFTAAGFPGDPDRTYSAALADLDGDGDLDVVVSNDRPDKKLVYFNDGSGRLTPGSTFGEPSWTTRYVTLADVNGDRRPDIIAANRGGNRATPSFVCISDGKGAFPSCRPLATQSATIIAAADLDKDGAIDLFVPHRDGGQNLIFWNDGKGDFGGKPTAVGPAKSSIRAACAADINGDGRLDLVAGDEDTGVRCYLQSAKREFGEPVMLGDPSRSPYAVAAADLNRDGKVDIVVGYQRARGAVFFGGGAKSFREVPWNDGAGSVYGVAIADLDGDGWPDIAAARSDARNGVWFSGPPARH